VKLKLLVFTAFMSAAAQLLPGATIVYVAGLSGAAESPANSSTATGNATVTIDTVLNLMRVQVQFSGLTNVTTASHIHCCTATPGTGTAGVATVTPTFTGFPSGVTSGTYDRTFNLLPVIATDTYNQAFVNSFGSIQAAETALLAGLAAGDAYLNIHTTQFPGGEIRGFLVATPEPATWIAGLGLLALCFIRRPSLQYR
jgi:hypothetical protein